MSGVEARNPDTKSLIRGLAFEPDAIRPIHIGVG